jgi:hypothetical protein
MLNNFYSHQSCGLIVLNLCLTDSQTPFQRLNEELFQERTKPIQEPPKCHFHFYIFVIVFHIYMNYIRSIVKYVLYNEV